MRAERNIPQSERRRAFKGDALAARRAMECQSTTVQLKSVCCVECFAGCIEPIAENGMADREHVDPQLM